MENKDFVYDILKTLGDPTRLRIFDILMTGVHCNCEISESAGLAMNLVSHHLRVLQEANLIVAKRNLADARWIYYTVNPEILPRIQKELTNFFDSNRNTNREPVCPTIKIKKGVKQYNE